MADRTVYIESAGGTYDGLNHAFTDEVALTPNLITDLDGILTFQCGNFEDATAATTGTGWTADASHYLNTIGDPADIAASTTGKWSTSRYRIVAPNNSHSLQFRESYTRIVDIQAKVTRTDPASGTLRGAIYSDDALTGILIDRCIATAALTGTSSSYYAAGIVCYGAESSGNIIRNCVVYGVFEAGVINRGIVVDDSEVQNCTVGYCNIGIRRASGTVTVKNCYAGGCDDTTDYSGTMTCTTCASSDSTVRSGVTADIEYTTDNFVNVTAGSEDLHIKATASATLLSGGTDLSAQFTLDIDGDTRSDWGIGADEYVAAGGNVFPLLITRSLGGNTNVMVT